MKKDYLPLVLMICGAFIAGCALVTSAIDKVAEINAHNYAFEMTDSRLSVAFLVFGCLLLVGGFIYYVLINKVKKVNK